MSLPAAAAAAAEGGCPGLQIAVLGLREAGSEIASDLVAAGAQVRGYDPRPDRSAPQGARDCRQRLPERSGPT
ncbi:MAG: hypothetical protein ACRDXC_04370 [Acidimicrobiales bacterium]